MSTSLRSPLVRPFRVPLCLAILLAGALATPAHAADLYLRSGFGYETSDDLVLEDVDCDAGAPAALFGCGAGNDGRPIAARGDLGATGVVELGAGVRIGDHLRLELALADRTGLDLEANANFPRVSTTQPVTADGRSVSAMLVAALDLGPASWRARPFVLAGAGAARNATSDVLFRFPSLAPNAVTVIQGGTHTDFAWTAGAGVSIRLSPANDLELAARWSDLGELRTDAGPATIVRSRGTFVVPVAPTHADVAVAGVAVSLRHRL